MFRVLLFLIACGSAVALEVAGFSPEVNNRFVSGYPQRPVLNSSRNFVGARYDWSGVGWVPGEPTHSVTLISPRHFVFATHQNVGQNGQEVHFVNREGVLKRYVIAKQQTVPFSKIGDAPAKGSDLSVGTLTEAIPESDHVAHYKVLFLGGAFPFYAKQKLLVYGHTAKIGVNEIVDGVIQPGQASAMRFLNTDKVPGYARTVSGDSGSPSFIPYAGELTLVGTHSEIGLDTFVPGLIDSINRLIEADRQTLGIIDAAKR